uniref:Uncharacterized protein n=1 Tax=viral metagenome TaxID=1070528 RepID=A0A6C0KRR6_9ZZZZ
MLNISTTLKETKEKKKKSKQLKVVSIDLIQTQAHEQDKDKVKDKDKDKDKDKEQDKEKLELERLKEQETLQKQKADLAINNIDLRYFANQNHNPSFRTNKLEQLLSTNYLLKDIYTNIEENIATYKEQIIKYNATTLEKLIENSDDSKIANGEKYKLYYLLYILNLISHLKEKKLKNSIKEELKDFTNAHNYCDDTSLNDFNLHNATLNSMCAKKCITNLDLFVVRKSSNTKRKILPQKRS